ADAGLKAPRPDGTPLRVADFGCGKGYLTFALHEHLSRTLGLPAEVTGIELRPELVQLCNDAVQSLGLSGLHFIQGDVRDWQPPALDVMIAL
ncbi:methyltransferase domain-containing protein, partial [Staphylococcus aureus]|nr:methyltransferase domain-containing protein [Staphylococcus aureus]